MRRQVAYAAAVPFVLSDAWASAKITTALVILGLGVVVVVGFSIALWWFGRPEKAAEAEDPAQSGAMDNPFGH